MVRATRTYDLSYGLERPTVACAFNLRKVAVGLLLGLSPAGLMTVQARRMWWGCTPPVGEHFGGPGACEPRSETVPLLVALLRRRSTARAGWADVVVLPCVSVEVWLCWVPLPTRGDHGGGALNADQLRTNLIFMFGHLPR